MKLSFSWIWHYHMWTFSRHIHKFLKKNKAKNGKKLTLSFYVLIRYKDDVLSLTSSVKIHVNKSTPLSTGKNGKADTTKSLSYCHLPTSLIVHLYITKSFGEIAITHSLVLTFFVFFYCLIFSFLCCKLLFVFFWPLRCSLFSTNAFQWPFCIFRLGFKRSKTFMWKERLKKLNNIIWIPLKSPIKWFQIDKKGVQPNLFLVSEKTTV